MYKASAAYSSGAKIGVTYSYIDKLDQKSGALYKIKTFERGRNFVGYDYA
jgi:hypothetical protein